MTKNKEHVAESDSGSDSVDAEELQADDTTEGANIGLKGIAASELDELMNEAIQAVETHAPGAIPSELKERVSPDELWEAPGPAPRKREADPYVEGLEEEVERLRSKCQSLNEDFVRFQKRSRDQSHKQEVELVANFVSTVLPLLDNMERAAKAAVENIDQDESLRDGLVMVHEQFLSILRNLNVFEVDTTDSLFDPENHEAVQQIKSEDQPDGTISDVNQKGFRIGKRLIRPARVVVVKNPKKKRL